jgi:DnaJ like chaperone protein
LFLFFGIQIARWLDMNPLSGMIAGLLIGHVLDHIATQKIYLWRVKRVQRAAAKTYIRENLIGTAFFLFGKLCSIDGEINEEETQAAVKMASDVFKLDSKDGAYALKTFKEAPYSNQHTQSSAVKLYEFYKDHEPMLEMCVHLCLELAASDSSITNEEEQLIRQISSVFGISDQRYQFLARPYLQGVKAKIPIEKCYAILGCTQADSDSTIKKNYRKLVSEYHPDKIQSKELPEDFISFANQKMNAIHQAYEAVKAARGIS